MAKAATDTGTPAPLKALGGWLAADWFCPSVLSDADVVGITLPKLAASRKQNFRLVERSTSPPAAGRPGRAGPVARSPKRPQASLADILDEFGTLQAAAFRRTSFLFESSPVLYFAEIPSAKLKIRAADNLRRALIDGGLRCCVLHVQPKSVLAMFWPASDHEITLFVREAAPPYALHAQFDGTAPAAPPRGEAPRRRAQGGRTAGGPLEPGEREGLLRDLAELRARVAELQQSQSALGAMEALGLDDARLKSMLRLLHPDKHGGSEAANEAAKWVNNLRDLLKSTRPLS